MMKIYRVECNCSTPDHNVAFCRLDEEVFIMPQLNVIPFWDRLKYLFGIKKHGTGSFGEVWTNIESLEEIVEKLKWNN
jgi:hypothetical protein